MPARRPVAIAFDVIETMFSLEALRPRLVALGLPSHALEAWFGRLLRDAFALDAAEVYKPFREVAAGSLEVLCATQGVRADAAALERVLAGFTELDVHPDVEPALKQLSKAGVTIATLTNGAAASTRKLLERAALDRYVSRVLSIDELKRWKPRREVY